MRRVAPVAMGVAFGLLGAGLAACFDLLHDTGDLKTGCQVDASTPGCAPDAGAATACAPSGVEARKSAQHACAWLGACEGPAGRNAFGSCMFGALLAFDCSANPNHRLRGKQASLWTCLARAQSCDEVNTCVFPAGSQACKAPGPGDFAACGTAESGTADNYDVLVHCRDDGGTQGSPAVGGENCALWGLTCSSRAGAGECSPERDAACPPPGCYAGSVVHWCSSGRDLGVDCSGSGASGCSVFPSRDAGQWAACLPEAAPGASCAPRTTATCNGGVAELCPAGTPESIDCAALLGAGPGAEACRPGLLDPPFDWTSACAVDPPACVSDSCDGGVLTGCDRGAALSVDCTAVGLGPCSMPPTLGPSPGVLHAACVAR
jgi:hypothetical protein